ncbi:MAG: hypothetical protein Q8Q23_03085 [bacterium]|nr:hypothetical protein [bacterium]
MEEENQQLIDSVEQPSNNDEQVLENSNVSIAKEGSKRTIAMVWSAAGLLFLATLFFIVWVFVFNNAAPQHTTIVSDDGDIHQTDSITSGTIDVARTQPAAYALNVVSNLERLGYTEPFNIEIVMSSDGSRYKIHYDTYGVWDAVYADETLCFKKAAHRYWYCVSEHISGIAYVRSLAGGYSEAEIETLRSRELAERGHALTEEKEIAGHWVPDNALAAVMSSPELVRTLLLDDQLHEGAELHYLNQQEGGQKYPAGTVANLRESNEAITIPDDGIDLMALAHFFYRRGRVFPVGMNLEYDEDDSGIIENMEYYYVSADDFLIQSPPAETMAYEMLNTDDQALVDCFVQADANGRAEHSVAVDGYDTCPSAEFESIYDCHYHWEDKMREAQQYFHDDVRSCFAQHPDTELSWMSAGKIVEAIEGVD